MAKRLRPRVETSKIYAPNSIYHGMPIISTSSRDDAILLQIKLGRLTDFVEFLFEHSEHCDHISQKDAWREFEIYEQKNSMIADKIRKVRAERRGEKI